MFVVRCGRQRTRQYSYCCRTRHYLHVITKLTTTQTQTLSFLPTQNSFKQHKQRSQTSEIHRNLSQSQREILDLCFLLDKLFAPTIRGGGGGGGEEEEEEPPRNSSKECAKTLSSQTLPNQKILSIFQKLHLTDSRHKLHQNQKRQKNTHTHTHTHTETK